MPTRIALAILAEAMRWHCLFYWIGNFMEDSVKNPYMKGFSHMKDFSYTRFVSAHT